MNFKGKLLNTFIRFGGLDLKNQKGYSKTPTSFHQPPATRGFYAMPKIAQEFFLISSLDKTQKEIFPKHPIKNDIPVDQEVWDIYHKRTSKVYESIRKEFKIKNDANIWHHLSVKNCEILFCNGSWVKTSFLCWEKAFCKESLRLRVESGSGNINSVRGITGMYSKDHFEVFFDEKVV